MSERLERRLASVERMIRTSIAVPAPTNYAINLFDRIPRREHNAIRNGDSAYDPTDYINDALVQVSARGGGRVHLPAGRWPAPDHDNRILLQSNTVLSGDGPGRTVIHGTDQIGTIHSTSEDAPVNWTIENLTVETTVAEEGYTAPIDLYGASYGLIRNVHTLGGGHGGLILERFCHDIQVSCSRIAGVLGNPATPEGGIGLWAFMGCYNLQFNQIIIEDIYGTGYHLDAGTTTLESYTVSHVTASDFIMRRIATGANVVPSCVMYFGASDCSFTDFLIDTVGGAEPEFVPVFLLGIDQGGAVVDRNVFANGIVKNAGSYGLAIQGGRWNNFRDIHFENILTATTGPGGTAGDGANYFAALVSAAAITDPAATQPLPEGYPTSDNTFVNITLQQDDTSNYVYGVKTNALNAYDDPLDPNDDPATLALVERNRWINCDLGEPTTARLLQANSDLEPIRGPNANIYQLGGPYRGTAFPASNLVYPGMRFYRDDVKREFIYDSPSWLDAHGSGISTGIQVNAPISETDGAGSITALRGVAVSTTTADNAAASVTGVLGDAAGTPDAGTTLSTGAGIRSLIAIARNLGTGTISFVYGLWSQIVNISGGHISTAIGAYVMPPNISGSTVENVFGFRAANQGHANAQRSYAVYVDTQSGSVLEVYSIYVVGGKVYFGDKVGIGTGSPTARLHLAAGVATAGGAPLKLTSGTNLTTPESGAFEFDGTNLYFTVGGVRKTVTLV